MKTFALAVVYISLLTLTACSVKHLPFIYQVPVQQGNVLSKHMVAQLKPGMTKRQVEFLMGTPSIMDPFHPDRWDYVYTNDAGGGPTVEKRVTVYFKNDKLVRVASHLKSKG